MLYDYVYDYRVMLEVDDLIKIYDTGDEALQGVSFAIDSDETVAIIGPSGAGKSTLIRCINRLVEPTDGRVVLDGKEVTQLSKSNLKAARKDMGFIFQEFNLIERLTVMENVLMGRLGDVSVWDCFRRNFEEEDVRRAYELLEQVGIAGLENNRADELSGGQRQRVGIARAVMQDPKILLVDEPTSSLDPESSHTVMRLLREITEESDTPALINIHDVDLAKEYGERIIGINDGSIVFNGSPDELDEQEQNRIYGAEYE
jgi:phosphonate transport system ATP-binding protein